MLDVTKVGPCGGPKTSRTDLQNAANVCRERVLARFPEFAQFRCDITELSGSVWFTGSQIWTAVYGLPAPDSDWDIFLTNDHLGVRDALDSLKDLLELNGCATIPTHQKNGGNNTYSKENNGMCYATPRGELDIWATLEDDVFGQLNEYKSGSHAHCRAAFNLKYGLVVMPNDMFGQGESK